MEIFVSEESLNMNKHGSFSWTCSDSQFQSFLFCYYTLYSKHTLISHMDELLQNHKAWCAAAGDFGKTGNFPYHYDASYWNYQLVNVALNWPLLGLQINIPWK